VNFIKRPLKSLGSILTYVVVKVVKVLMNLYPLWSSSNELFVSMDKCLITFFFFDNNCNLAKHVRNDPRFQECWPNGGRFSILLKLYHVTFIKRPCGLSSPSIVAYLSVSSLSFISLLSFLLGRLRAEAPFPFLYKDSLYRSVPQPFLFMLRYFSFLSVCVYRLTYYS
jgi:hypothetical protein